MPKPIFKDGALQKQFEKDGYLVVRNLLSGAQVKHLSDFYAGLSKQHYGDKMGMHTSAHTSNAEMLTAIHNEFRAIVGDTIDKHLCNYKFYGGSYLVKESRPDSFFDVHQDWTCVDETKYCSLNIWMPLQETNRNNGYMFYLKGSHRLIPALRFAPQCPVPFDKIRSIAPYYYSYEKAQAGDVVFCNNATAHGSVVNQSGKTRLAAVLGAYSAGADLLHYFCEPGSPLDKIEKYTVCPESFIHMQRGQRPVLSKFEGYITYEPKMVEVGEFVRFMNANSTISGRVTYFLRRLNILN